LGGEIIVAGARSCSVIGRALDSLGGGTLYPTLGVAYVIGREQRIPQMSDFFLAHLD
jgi:hypothetical protein